MTEYFILILVTSFWCCGLNTITLEGTIGYPLRMAARRLPALAAKPLIDCLPCMASIHTGIVYLFLHFTYGFQLNFLIYVFAAVSTAFGNIVLWSFFGAYKFLTSLGND